MLEQWGKTWGMRFNAKKCNILRISRSKTPFTKFYDLYERILDEVDEAKYLGILVSNDLQWSSHIKGVSKKANATLGFLRRNLRHCPQKFKEGAYIAMVRSVLEYSGSVWDPYLVKDKDALEKIQ